MQKASQRKDVQNHSASLLLLFAPSSHPRQSQKQMLLPWQHYRINLLLLNQLYPTRVVSRQFVSFSCSSSAKVRLHNSDTDLPQRSHESLLLTPISELEGLVVHLSSSLSQRTLNKIYTCYWWEGANQHIRIQWDSNPVFFLTEEEDLNGQHRATTWKKQVLIRFPLPSL